MLSTHAQKPAMAKKQIQTMLIRRMSFWFLKTIIAQYRADRVGLLQLQEYEMMIPIITFKHRFKKLKFDYI